MNDIAPPLNVEDDLFNFESGHLALKGNEDYCDVLKTLVILSAQRERALKDFKTIAELRVEALKNPFETLEKIKNGSDLGMPPHMELPELPKIDFKKYKVSVPESELNEIYSKGREETEKPEIKNPTHDSRVWTLEEQKRLEELLQIYPTEEVEMKRFQKIAKALGTKTTLQVASRLQKYFMKLYKAGLPIPGRIPKAAEKHRKSSLHKHQRHNHFLWKPSTFFPELSVPVKIDDLDNIPGPSEAPSSSTSSSDNYLVRTDYHYTKPKEEGAESALELQLKLLKRVREVKALEEAEGWVPFTHLGYTCDYCDEFNLTGTRWHCTVCPESVDFCTDCVISQMYSESPHSYQHWLAPYRDDSGAIADLPAEQMGATSDSESSSE